MSGLAAPLSPGATPQVERKKSVPGLAPINTATTRRPQSPSLTSPPGSSAGPTMHSAHSGSMAAATSAANAAFPRSPLPSPGPQPTDAPMLTVAQQHLPESSHTGSISGPTIVPERELKHVRSKMKLFSKPKSIGITKDKEGKNAPLPSPVRGTMWQGLTSASTTSLLENASSNASIYSASNASTNTLVPVTTTTHMLEREKEANKHRPHFLSRQKHKQSERNLHLSSASSNSQAVDPSAPQSLYSFAAPQSPGAQSTFAKSMSGLDLRHGGRALREKKKEEKAAANMGLTQVLSNGSTDASDHRGDFFGPTSVGAQSIFGPSQSSTNMYFDERSGSISAVAFTSLGSTMGLNGITPDDAWPLLKARLLNIFEGEDLRTPIEDFNLLVSVHVRRCIQKRAPTILLEDLRELLATGFSSLAQTLRSLPDDKLVPRLVELWLMVYCTVLPFIQAVFLPLDLEFRGHGPVMSARDAAQFWGAMPDTDMLDVRRITLVAFRDAVILPRHETLLNMFSRLSLDSLNSGPLPVDQFTAANRVRTASNAGILGGALEKTNSRLGGGSPHLGSYNSQASTLLDAASLSSGGGLSSISRSRATSNTSAGSFATSLTNLPSPIQERHQVASPPRSSHSHARQNSASGFLGGIAPQQATQQALPSDPAKITQTVARLLQCFSVVAAAQTGDAGQAAVEKLTVALKHNWLGRGRTGRQRRGWVGMRVGRPMGGPPVEV